MSIPFLEVSTVLGCAVDCHFCPQQLALDRYHEHGGASRVMTLETFKTCLDKMPPETEVSFAGFAEPWLNNQCTAMSEYCRASGHQWEAYTTCVGMSMNDARRVNDAKPIRLKLHLPDVEGYAKIKWDAAYIAVVKELMINTPWSHMTMGTLPPEFNAIFGKTKAAPMHTRAGNVTPLVQLTPERKTGLLKCRPGPALDRNILLPDGSLTLCCMDFGQRHVIGNLLESSWDEIRNGKPLAAIRAAMAGENDDVLCRTCEVAVAAN